MLQKFIWWTGLSDFLVGAGTWAGAVAIANAAEPVTGQFVPLITLGTFLMMAAALLMWSSPTARRFFSGRGWCAFRRLLR